MFRFCFFFVFVFAYVIDADKMKDFEEEADDDHDEEPDTWHCPTTGTADDTTLDYLASVSVVPLDKLEFYNELFELNHDRVRK